MDALVATLTQNKRPEWLDEARMSVPSGFRHCVVSDGGDFQGARWALAQSAECVAWLDDDDRLVSGGLEACIAALTANPHVGVAFTYEARIDESGARFSEDVRPRTYLDVAMHPRELHHLAVVRRGAIDPAVLGHAQRIGCGVDWLMRASAALQYGAVQVPVLGYEWRDHRDTLTRRSADAESYSRAMPLLRGVTRSWMKYDAPIRQFLPSAL